MKPDDKGKHSSRLFYNYVEEVKKISRDCIQRFDKQIIGYTQPPTWLNSFDNSETVTLSGFNRYRVIYNQQQPPKADACRIRSEPVSQTKPMDSRAISKDLMIGLAIKDKGFFDPKNERRGKQADAVRFFQKQLEKEGLT